MKRWVWIAACCLFSTSAASQEIAQLRCVFDRYASESEVKKLDSPLVLVFKTMGPGRFFVEGNWGQSLVTGVTGMFALTFIEELPTGAVQTTTILQETGEAVHSRHTVIGPSFAASQNYGICE